jgi:hypothetical protein
MRRGMTQRLFLIYLAGIAVTLGLIYAAKDVRAQDCYHCAVAGGDIEGHVFNAQGQPVRRAIVYALKQDFEKGVVPSAETDKNGFFRLTVATGAYKIYAGKESAGYPESLATIYQNVTSYVDVHVDKDQVTSGVVLRLGKRLRKLSGRIIDASTKVPIAHAHIKLGLSDNPAYYFGTNVDENGRFEILAPSVPFTIEVSASGYEKRHLEPLQLRKPEAKRLDISLHLIK